MAILELTRVASVSAMEEVLSVEATTLTPVDLWIFPSQTTGPRDLDKQ